MIQFNRSKYLQKLISHKHNRLVKIVTGVRRCGGGVIGDEELERYYRKKHF